MEAYLFEGELKTKLYINLPKVMVELGFMRPKEYYNTFSEIKGGMYGCVDASLLWFVHFCKCAVSSKGLGLTQSKVD